MNVSVSTNIVTERNKIENEIEIQNEILTEIKIGNIKKKLKYKKAEK